MEVRSLAGLKDGLGGCKTSEMNVPKNLQKSKFYKTICEALEVCEKSIEKHLV